VKHLHRNLLTCGLLALVTGACTVTEGEIDDEPTSVGNVNIESLGSEDVDSTGETEVTVEVPAGAQSFALVVDGAGSELVIADKVTSQWHRLLRLQQRHFHQPHRRDRWSLHAVGADSARGGCRRRRLADQPAQRRRHL